MKKKQLALLLLCNTALIVALYFVLASLGIWFIMPIYILAAAILGMIFIIYNRGFSAKGATPDQLPDSMSREEKRAYLDAAADRLERSKWMLTLLLPILVAIACDMIYLYLYPMITELF